MRNRRDKVSQYSKEKHIIEMIETYIKQHQTNYLFSPDYLISEKRTKEQTFSF